jgi:cytosine permease
MLSTGFSKSKSASQAWRTGLAACPRNLIRSMPSKPGTWLSSGKIALTVVPEKGVIRTLPMLAVPERRTGLYDARQAATTGINNDNSAMNNQETQTPSPLPSYITSAAPNPKDKRGPWYANTAPTYAGIFLWFAFWDSMSANGLSVGGLGATLLGIILGGIICHFLFYLVPGLLGMKTGLPLYVVGTSTFGAVGGLLMPGFFMGVLQFGWLAVNTFYSSQALADGLTVPSLFYPLCVIWALGAAFVGLKGIQYVAKVATYLPIIPFVVLVIGLVLFCGSAGNYAPPATAAASGGGLKATLIMIGAIVGFFATAGAAGVDICANNRDKNDVSMGGIVGIIIAIVFTAGISVIAVAGATASGVITAADPAKEAVKMTFGLKKSIPNLYPIIMIGLTLASFPGACFSSFIAANSFKTVMPRVNPFLSVGVGAIVSIILAITGWAGNLGSVFGLIGASFGPICGAMMVDYLLSGGKWSGPRAGFNPAGWISWALGFIVGILPNELLPEAIRMDVPCAPVAAFIVGAVVYFICAKAGVQSAVVPMSGALPETTK